MSRIVSIHLEWVYTSENYFEGQITISFEGGEIEIDQDMVFAEISHEIFTGNEDLAGDLDDRGENRFQNAQQVNNNA